MIEVNCVKAVQSKHKKKTRIIKTLSDEMTNKKMERKQ